MNKSKFKTNDYWHEINHRYLMQEIARIRHALVQRSELMSGEISSLVVPDFFPNGYHTPPAEVEPISPPPLIEQICQIFRLSSFERDVLLLCAGMEFDSTWGMLCGEAQGNPELSGPTFALAFSVLEGGYWAAMAPNAPLRRWRLIEVGIGDTVTASILRIDERILHYLHGIQYIDDRLAVMEEPIPISGILVPSHHQLVEQIEATWIKNQAGILPMVQLCGEEVASKRAIARAVCDRLGLNLHALSGESLPLDSTGLNGLKLLYEREWALNSTVLLLNCDRLENIEAAKDNAIATLIENLNSPLILSSSDRRRLRQRPPITLDVYPPTSDEQRLIWKNALGEMAVGMDGMVNLFVSHFNLSAPAIQAACLTVKGLIPETREDGGEKGDGGDEQSSSTFAAQLQDKLWHVCCIQARPRLEELAQRLDSVATFAGTICFATSCCRSTRLSRGRIVDNPFSGSHAKSMARRRRSRLLATHFQC